MNQDPRSSTTTSSGAPAPVGAYPYVRQVGNLLFLSGIGPRQAGSNSIPGVNYADDGSVANYDIAAQCHAVFKNVRTVLEEAGSCWESLVDVTVFLTDIRADFEIYNRIYAEYFVTNQPCRTTVEINRLPTPIAIELKCIATMEPA